MGEKARKSKQQLRRPGFPPCPKQSPTLFSPLLVLISLFCTVKLCMVWNGPSPLWASVSLSVHRWQDWVILAANSVRLCAEPCRCIGGAEGLRTEGWVLHHLVERPRLPLDKKGLGRSGMAGPAICMSLAQSST